MYYPFVRKALFQLDPERAHEFTFQQLRRITGTPFEALVRQKVPAKPVNCMGLTFKNPLGLAAGLDKDGECITCFRADFAPSLHSTRRNHLSPARRHDTVRLPDTSLSDAGF